MNQDLISSARSFLFVPGNRPERFSKALQSGADAVVIDLEDSVPAHDKHIARMAVADALPSLMGSGVGIVVRINPPGTEEGEADLVHIGTCQLPDGVMLPKCDSAQVLQSVASKTQGVKLLPLIESAAGYLGLGDIAGSGLACRLVVGHIDFLADTGMTCQDEQRELDPLRFQVSIQSRVNHLALPVDGVTTSVDDEDLLRQDTLRAVRFGFGAKLCIHPKQVRRVHEFLAPTQDQVDWARRVLAAVEVSQGAAVQVDGKMVDLPVEIQARHVLSRLR